MVDADEIVGTYAGEGCVKAIDAYAIGYCGDDVKALAKASVPGPEEELAFELIGVGLGMGEDKDVFILVHGKKGLQEHGGGVTSWLAGLWGIWPF